MAKKQTRRSVSLSQSTYERLRAYCETNDVSMSEFVEGRIGDYLGRGAKRQADKAAAPSPQGETPRAGGIFTF